MLFASECVQPHADLFPPAVDVAGASVIVPQQVVPEAEPVCGVPAVVLEQARDEPLTFVGARVGDERPDLRRRWQQAHDVERGSTDEDAIVGQYPGRRFVLGKVQCEKAIDRIQRGIGRRRELRRSRGEVARRCLRERDAGIPRKALINPRSKQPHLRGCQPRSLLRHDFVRIDSRHHRDEVTLRTIAHDDCGTVVAAFEEQLARLDTEAAAASSAPMTSDAAHLKDGFDVGVEGNGPIGCRGQLCARRSLSVGRAGSRHRRERSDQTQPDSRAVHDREGRERRAVSQPGTCHKKRGSLPFNSRARPFFPLFRAADTAPRVRPPPTGCDHGLAPLSARPLTFVRGSVLADVNRRCR